MLSSARVPVGIFTCGWLVCRGHEEYTVATVVLRESSSGSHSRLPQSAAQHLAATIVVDMSVSGQRGTG